MKSTPIFISYSREDAQWVRSIRESLEKLGIQAWVDTNALDYASLWREEIEEAILRAQLVVVLVTPHFLNSSACRFEVERAERLRKRLLPIIDSDVEAKQIPAALGAYQWFKLDRNAGNTETAAAWIERSLNLDPDWLRQHTDFTLRARQWKTKEQDPSLLLRGKELVSAQTMLEQSREKEHSLSADLLELIAVSDQIQARRRMTLASFVGGSLFAIFAAASFGYIQHVQAEGEAQSALRDRLNQLAMAGDVSGLLDTAKANESRLEKDPVAMLQVRLFESEALSTNLGLQAIEVDSLEVKGNWALLHNFSSGGQLVNLEQWEEPNQIADWSESETHRVSLSTEGDYHAVWTNTQFSIRPSASPNTNTPIIKSPQTIEHITLLDAPRSMVIQHSGEIAVYPWEPEQNTLPNATTRLTGAQLLRAFPNGDLLYRKPLTTPGEFELWLHSAGSDVALGKFKGLVRQVWRNRDEVIAIRIKREVHGFHVKKDNTGFSLEPLGKVWVADESGVALSNHGHSLAITDPNNEARILYFSQEDTVISEGKALRQDPAALRDDLAENLNEVRNSAASISDLQPVFDQDDSRLFAPGEFNRILSPINAQTIASMDSELGTAGGLADNLMALSGDGKHLIGLSLNHGGNGTVTLHRFTVPDRLQQGRTPALATAMLEDESGFLTLQPNGALLRQGWAGKEPSTIELKTPSPLVAGTIASNGKQIWAIDSAGELQGWAVNENTATPTFKQTIDVNSLGGLNRLRALSVSADGKRLALVGLQRLMILDATNGQTRCSLEHTEQFYDGAAYFLDNSTVVSVDMLFTNGTGWENRRIRTFDSKTCGPTERFAPRPELQESDGYEAGFGFGIQNELDGTPWIADRSFGAKYRIRDLQTGQIMGALSSHRGRILAMRLHPASKLLISSDESGSINIWERDTLRKIKTLDAPQCQAVDLSMSEKASHLLARCANGQAIWWNLGQHS